jgi:hypothetical protein
MKQTSQKDRYHEIFTFIFSVVLAAVICLGGFSDNIALAVASFMFYSGDSVTKPEAEATNAVTAATITQTTSCP